MEESTKTNMCFAVEKSEVMSSSTYVQALEAMIVGSRERNLLMFRREVPYIVFSRTVRS